MAKRINILHICETCMKDFDGYDCVYVYRDGYYSVHCDGCAKKHNLPVKCRFKEKTNKNIKSEYKSKK